MLLEMNELISKYVYKPEVYWWELIYPLGKFLHYVLYRLKYVSQD